MGYYSEYMIDWYAVLIIFGVMYGVQYILLHGLKTIDMSPFKAAFFAVSPVFLLVSVLQGLGAAFCPQNSCAIEWYVYIVILVLSVLSALVTAYIVRAVVPTWEKLSKSTVIVALITTVCGIIATVSILLLIESV